MAKQENVLIIFMKAPRMGTVKTRLQPQLSAEQSLALYMAMGEDLVARFRNSSDFDLQIHFWPPDAGREMQRWLGANLHYIPQNEGNLGSKMHLAFVYVFDQGYRKAVIIGSDLPALTGVHIRNAFQYLEKHDVVLGPTDDGGYYLIGLRASSPELFENVKWSSGEVWQQTLENLRKNGLHLAQLRQETDVDTFAEVIDLWKRLNQPKSGIDEKNVPRTAAILAKIFR
jgi:rSAM/selenodomain-associated transferase 1